MPNSGPRRPATAAAAGSVWGVAGSGYTDASTCVRGKARSASGGEQMAVSGQTPHPHDVGMCRRCLP